MDDDDDWDDAMWSTIDALETSHLQNKQDRVHDAADADGQWACRSCTLLNGATRTTCSVCSTPRGQVFTAAQQRASAGTGAAAGATVHDAFPSTAAVLLPQASASLLLSQQSKKTIQATLPFARTGGGATTTAAASAATRTTGTTASIQRHSSVHDMRDQRRQPPMGSKSTNPLGFPPRSGATLNGTNNDDVDEPEDGDAALAAVARLRLKGEDGAAKMRYLMETEAQAMRHHPQIDRDAATTFVYPTNYSVREYQLTIAEKALYHNTLVSLPTGLGKTLIASVVMYNFYRWFPQGQIVFMAPTKPLVAQQIGACHEIMGIPLCDTAELQGSVPPATRKVLWSTKRVFFCTPQSMQNDLQRGICRAERLVCLVVDEAHRATGNYAYCGVIQEVEKLTNQFRVLALSATPGAKFDVIQDVIRNLRITHIESRSADDTDVKKYTHARQEEVIRCSLTSQIAETKTLFLRVFERIAQRLLIGNIIQHKDPERLTRWYVLQMRDKFRASPNYQSNRSAESDLAVLVSLLHARDLLTGHGLSSFKGWLDDFMTEEQVKGKRVSWSKIELLQSTEFHALRLSLEHVGGADTLSSASHPKLLKLREVLHEHFQRHSVGQSSTRAIVFTQYRSSVQEIVRLLEPLFPLIKAQQFVGQSASGKGKESKGQTQKEQQEIVRKFRSGLFNVLVATCIAEEGLDIGEVDLIVSFDALTSPVRMIQRMGRTGRKRVGKVVILVTEGDEEKKLARSVASAKTVSRALTTFKSKFVYSKCPRMIPHGISPTLSALQMDIPEFHASQIGGKQAAPRLTRMEGDGVIERRDAWKLNELERSMLRGKYATPEWPDAARHDFFPISGSRKILLRRRRQDDQVRPPSARSRALMSIVRGINGVHYDDDVVGHRSLVGELPPSATLGAYEVIGQHDGDVLDFSDPDDGRAYDNHMHFSPPCSGVPEPTTPVRTQGAQTPRTVGDLTHHVTSSTKSAAHRSSVSKVTVSPLRQVTITGKPSPSPSRRSSTGSGRKSRKKLEKPRDAIDESLLERGERLLERINAMLSDPIVVTADRPSPEPEPPTVADEAPAAEIQFQFPRIARRLKFDEPTGFHPGASSFAGGTENCVPLPPTLSELYPASLGKNPVTATASEGGGKSSVGDSKVTHQANEPGRVNDFRRTTLCTTNGSSPASAPHACKGDQEYAHQSSSNQQLLRAAEPENNRVTHRFEGLDFEADSPMVPRFKKPKRSLALRVPIDELADEVKPTTSQTSSTAAPLARSTTATALRHDECERISKNTARPTRNDVEKDFATLAAASATQREHSSASFRHTQGDPCSVCCEHESFDDDPIVFCDGCNVAVHQFCYGIPILPSEDWYCDSCREITVQGKPTTKPKPRRCALCPMRNDTIVMKQTECGQWVHVQCFMWIPELQFRFESKILRLGPLARLDPDRKSLDCSLCHSKRGHGTIQCAHKRCLHAFHVSCAFAAPNENYKLAQLDEEECVEGGTVFIAFCPLHNKSTAIWKPTEKSASSPLRESKASLPRVPNATPAYSPARSSALSPSALLASQSNSSQKQRKQFRRLKRKYDTARLSDVSTQRTPPIARSPWAKKVRRSEQHAQGKRAQAKALARIFIEDEVEAPSSDGDDDEDDDEMDEEDRDFINDSSQLIYSPSVPTPVRKKKSKRNSLGDMRAIYARSLIESPQTPAFLRRGRNNLPSNGIISACLQELKAERGESPSTSSSHSSQSSQASCQATAELTDEVIEILDESQTDQHPNLDHGRNKEVEGSQSSIPSFDLLGMVTTTRDPIETTSHPVSEKTTAPPIVGDGENDEDRRLREKIEANRLKALRLLEAKKQEAGRVPVSATVGPPKEETNSAACDTNNRHSSGLAHEKTKETLQVAKHVVSPVKVAHEAPSFSLLEVAPANNPTPSIKHPTVASSRNETSGVLVYVQPAFRESQEYDILEACASTESDRLKFEEVESLDVSALLSLRVAAIVLEVKMTETSNLLEHAMVQLACRVYKSFVLVIRASDISSVATISHSDETRQIRELPSCRNVIVACESAVIAKALLSVAREEASLGFGLAMISSASQLKASSGVDVNFHERYRFFQLTGVLSIGSAISLSFRFDKFTVKQIPVTKFGEMHWRRMLPWISAATAKQLHSYFLQRGIGS